MNNVFDFNRASQYAVYTVRSGAKRYAMAVGAGIVCALIFLFFMVGVGPKLSEMYTTDAEFWSTRYGYACDPMWNNLSNIFWIGLFVVLCLAASLSYSCLGTKEGRISQLMVPASNLEKYVVRWLIFIPMTLVVYLIGFAVVDLIRLAFTYMAVPDTQYLLSVYKNPQGPLPLHFLTEPGFAILVFMQSFFFLGSTVWPKLSVVKTLLAGAIIVLVITLLSVWLANMLFSPDMTYNEPLRLSAETLIRTVFYLMSIPCYVIAYFRIKEIEIIQRW